MKIGIVTQPVSRNYGGILQNYALQQTLIKLGHTPYTFDLGKYTWKNWGVTTIKSIIKKLIGRPYHFPETPYKRNKSEEILRDFVKQHINLISPRNYRPDPNKIKEYGLEALIVGSDQVWRPMYNYNIEDMFLRFAQSANIKRIAYAASFGTGQWEYNDLQTANCKTLAHEFDAISVREDSAVDLCKKYLGVEAIHTLDPTMLLTFDEYNKLLLDMPRNTNRVLFAYLLDITEQKVEYVKNVATSMGLEPIIMSAHTQLSASDSIEKWLANFRDAQYIVTDSFHGCAFSIIYNVDFTVIGNMHRGLDRMTSLLKSVGLMSRLIDESNLKSEQYTQIDWNKVNIQLNSLRKDSISFLTRNI